jgi:hypothetical protein
MSKRDKMMTLQEIADMPDIETTQIVSCDDERVPEMRLIRPEDEVGITNHQKYEEARERAKSKMRDLIRLAYESRGYVWEDDETPEIRALVDDIIDASVHKTLEILSKSIGGQGNG